ncbi:tRNA (adenosine(37)-N6)-threonylcarbamoyltransferase complex ATPase subunit type 1 TsaE [Candidatus Kuenenbacteria bacterium]|nr:tRNA (adenosine(37)-N6)-threonylcarbamoyltransferase complex ATPase subunit type 1 TsaE [Candidatus Kuenenbacteria bacterium]
MSQITAHSISETQKLAVNFIHKITGPAVLGLVGALGSGKTHFTKGLAQGLKIKKHITSPTFVLLKIYPAPQNKKGIKNLIHVDCYRLGHEEELLALGWEEILRKNDSLIVVEWADKIKSIMPQNTIWFNFRQGRGEEERIISTKPQIQNPK